MPLFRLLRARVLLALLLRLRGERRPSTFPPAALALLALLGACADSPLRNEGLQAEEPAEEPTGCYVDYEHNECAVTVCPAFVLIVGCDGFGYETWEGN